MWHQQHSRFLNTERGRGHFCSLNTLNTGTVTAPLLSLTDRHYHMTDACFHWFTLRLKSNPTTTKNVGMGSGQLCASGYWIHVHTWNMMAMRLWHKASVCWGWLYVWGSPPIPLLRSFSKGSVMLPWSQWVSCELRQEHTEYKNNKYVGRLTPNFLLLPAVSHMSWGTNPVHHSALLATSSPAAPTPEWRHPYWSSDGCLSLLSKNTGPGPTGCPLPADKGTERQREVHWVFERLYISR